VALGGGRTRDARRIGFYGRRLGRAFQIIDDVFDIARSADNAGKLPGTDLARRRLTLPIIYAMDELGPDHAVTRIMKGAEFSRDELADAVQAVRRSDGFVKAYQEARLQALDSLRYLEPFVDNEYKQALENIVMYVVNRGYKS
jgi:heptaprenyl diphosphate synthase